MMNAYTNIRIAYYSGTGSTELVAKTFQSYLESKGCVCSLEKITYRPIACPTAGDLLLLLFPVHAFNAPEAVYQWIAQLNEVDTGDAAVISVSGGGEVCPNTACRVSSIKGLREKGYQVRYDKMIVMPSNWMASAPSPLPYLLMQALPKAVQQITEDLLSGIQQTGKPLWIDRLFSVMGELEKPAGRFWGKRIQVLKACTGCSWCAKHCPAGNITMINGVPTFENKCHLCLNCIYGCPSKALQPGTCKFVIIKEGYCLEDMSEMLLPHMQVPLEDIKVGFFWLGVKKYLLSVERGKKR
ncbi:hypothetical protein Ami103574_11480 [Aminipila butyrica]|uniref:4Fe-4S ferredoxin-type domain-containing protein n=1 Tax=Aminipila butyrica TaxID=433296 RepID=A0A858BXT8_9FIRM|nr:EFR1 family ferrodoxin [Aminipila butyrica]QIB69905.1 hypothetical protein Ami103574_11480 [Aminipila butyrica]